MAGHYSSNTTPRRWQCRTSAKSRTRTNNGALANARENDSGKRFPSLRGCANFLFIFDFDVSADDRFALTKGQVALLSEWTRVVRA
jgi:hypothetical protein